jgi:long-chain acyl-CoA synthetase
VAVPLNPTLTEFELGRLIVDAEPVLALVDSTVSSAVATAAPDLALVVIGDSGAPAESEGRPADNPGPEPYESFIASGQAVAATETDPESLALLLFTSGTSGRAKGAMLSHRALLANVANVAAVETPTVRPEDVVLVVLPLFHVYSLNGTLAAIADQAATAVIVDRFDAQGCLEVIRRHGVTNVPGAPPMFTAWSRLANLREAFASVRMLFTGAAPMPPAVTEAIAEACGLPVFEGYGLTEAAPGVTSTVVGGSAKPGSVGRPFPGVELRLLDESGELAEDGDPGEISIRGANLFSGYWPDAGDGPDAEGWFATGDVGYLDDDGDLVLVDRRKELVIVNGFNVYPSEVEEALVEHPDIDEIAVIGIPNEQTGESVKAYVVARPGSGLEEAAVLDFARTRLARFKSPSTVVIVEELPHSATGKVAKGQLRENG